MGRLEARPAAAWWLNSSSDGPPHTTEMLSIAARYVAVLMLPAGAAASFSDPRNALRSVWLGFTFTDQPAHLSSIIHEGG